VSAALSSLRLRLQRLPLEHLEQLAERDGVPPLALDVVLAELARRRDAPTTLAGAWDVLTHSPPGTPPSLDRDIMQPAQVVRVRSPLASLQARELARATDAPIIRRRYPLLPMKRGRHVWVSASGMVLSIQDARDVLAALRSLCQ